MTDHKTNLKSHLHMLAVNIWTEENGVLFTTVPKGRKCKDLAKIK